MFFISDFDEAMNHKIRGCQRERASSTLEYWLLILHTILRYFYGVGVGTVE